MSKIFVSGLVNLEMSLQVDYFPIQYNPIEYPFFGISQAVSGVGYNVSKALSILGDDAFLTGFIGDDLFSKNIKETLESEHINFSFEKSKSLQTPTSLVLFDKDGKRKIYCDLKDLQEMNLDVREIDFNSYDLFVITNINFNRSLIKKCKSSKCKIATDVHCISSIDDNFNKDFMMNADYLFLSNEYVKGNEADFIKTIYEKYNNEIIVIGCGSEGALAYCGKENKYYYSQARAPFGVKSTVGAGDALFSSFLHFYLKNKDIQKSLNLATLFAGCKVSKNGGSNGFIDEKRLVNLL